MADAVCLVDGEGASLQTLDELQEARRQQTLGRHKYQAVAAGGDFCFGLANGVKRHAAVQRCRRIAALAQAVDLIFHQRDERRNHNVRALCQLGRHLIAERLATSGWHNNKRVALFETRSDRLFLQRTQLGVAPVTAHGGENVGSRPA
jgi:hypothetical protein